MKKTTKIILSSVMTMALSASLIAGSTLAFFSSEDELNVAINSGKVEVTATVEETSITSYSAEWNGSAYEEKQAATGSTGSFTTGGTYSYSSVGGLTLNNIAPGDIVEFNLKIENASTIDIKYRAQITATEDTEENAIYKVLKVTFGENEETTFESSKTIAQKEWTEVEANEQGGTIHVKIEFPIENSEQNQYQNKTCTLKVGVYAVQQNAHVDE